jgi:hypothetical protein
MWRQLTSGLLITRILRLPDRLYVYSIRGSASGRHGSGSQTWGDGFLVYFVKADGWTVFVVWLVVEGENVLHTADELGMLSRWNH